MKIGLFIDCWEPCIGGVIVSTKSLREGLETLGHKVYIITLNAVPKQIEKDPFIIRLQGGLPVFLKGLKDYRFLFKYKKYLPQIEALNLDIIHVHTELGVGKLGLYAHEKLKLPLIYTMHSMYHFFLEKNKFLWIKILKKILIKYLDYLLKKFISKSDIVITPTKKTLYFLEERYKIKQNYKIIPSGIPLNKFDPQNFSKEQIDALKEKLDLKNFFVCLFVGRLSKEKDIDFIIDHFASFHEINNKSKFLIIGDGPEKINLQNKVKKINLQDKIIFLNFIPNNQIGLYYQLGDVFVNASLFETQGLTFIEALSSALPVLARYDEALDGVIENQKNGFFYKDKKDFVKILNDLCNNKQKYQEISKQAQNSIQDYKQEIFSAKMIDIYKAAISENNLKLKKE